MKSVRPGAASNVVKPGVAKPGNGANLVVSLKSEAMADKRRGETRPLGRAALDVAMAWSIVGIFVIVLLACIHYLSIVLIPITMAIVVGMILGIASGKLVELGIPSFAVSLLLSSLVAILLFVVVNSLAGPLTIMATQGPAFLDNTVDRLVPYLERLKWINISADSLRSGPMSLETVIQNGGSIVGIVTANITPAIVQALIFFAGLLLFLYSRLKLRRGIIMLFPQRKQRLRTIRVISAVEQVLGNYFAIASLLYAAMGVCMALIAYLAGFPMPLLWGLFAFISCFVPFLGVTAMTVAVTIAGILSFDTLPIGLIPAFLFFTIHMIMENLVFPSVVGKNMEINPFVVFVAIIFWTWLWGAAGAMLALPLSLIFMTVADELFSIRRTVPQLPA